MALTLLKPYNLDSTQNYTFGNATVGNISTANISVTSAVDSTSTTTGALVVTGGIGLSANLTVGGVSTLGPVGNVKITGGSSGQYLQTNGSGTLTWATISASSVSNGNSNVSIPTANGNVNISAVGNANVFVVTGTGANANGYLTVTGNITSGNANLGNLASANYFSGNGSLLTSLTGGNVTGQVANALVAGTVYTAAQPNITSVGTLTSLAVTGNVSAGNATLGNLASANYFSGDGSLLTGVVASSSGTLSNGTSNASIPTSGGNILFSVGGTANVSIIHSLGANVFGTFSVTGNSNVGNLGTNGLINATGNITGGNLTTAGNLSVTGNAAIGNLTVDGITTLGAVTHVKILGGTSGYVLKTDGTGNLSWTAPASGGGGGGGGALTVTDDTSTDAVYYPVYSTSNTGDMTVAGISTTKLQFNPSSGQLTVQDLNTLSDATLKTNPEQIADPMAILSQLFGMGFNWLDSGKKSYGLMAQMLEKVLPELVSTNAQGKKTVNYIPIIAFLVEAVKKQQQDIEDLKKR